MHDTTPHERDRHLRHVPAFYCEATLACFRQPTIVLPAPDGRAVCSTHGVAITEARYGAIRPSRRAPLEADATAHGPASAPSGDGRPLSLPAPGGDGPPTVAAGSGPPAREGR